MPNFAASASIWNVTASGVSSRTGLPVCLWTFCAHTSSCTDLPSPQSSNSPARPCRTAQSVMDRWKPNRKSGSHSGSNPAMESAWARRSRYSA